MFIDAQQNKYTNSLSFFILLKLLFIGGKTRFNDNELDNIEKINEIKSRKTTKKHIKILLEKGWIVYNSKTGFYILKSFDQIRKENGFFVRLAFPIEISYYKKLRAITGAVIYGYLHKDFWRKVKSEKSVQIKGSTYHFPTPNFNYKKQYAPVSVIGVFKIFNISIPTASRLKNAAAKEKFIKLKKNYSEPLPNIKELNKILEYNDMNNNLVYHNDEFRLQYIDTIYPLFFFIKRKTLKT
jgi:hypothetical protein